MGTSVTNGVFPEEFNGSDSASGRLRGPASNGDRVYKRRMKSLKSLPVQVVSHPNYAEGREVGSLSNLMTSAGPKGGGRHHSVGDRGKSRAGHKVKLLASDGNNHLAPSRSKLSLIEVTPEAGQVRSGFSVLYVREPGPEKRASQVVTVLPTSRMQSRVSSTEVLGDSDRNGKKSTMKSVNQSSGVQRQSTLDQFFRDPVRKAEDGGLKHVFSRRGPSGVEVNVRGVSKRDRKSPAKSKRKKTIVENLAAPPKGNIFAPVPMDDDFLGQEKRKKIRKKDGRDGTRAVAVGTTGSPSRKRLSIAESDMREGQLHPALAKKRRKLATVPPMQCPESSDEKEYKSLGSIPVEAVGSSHPNGVPVRVPMGSSAVPQSIQPPVSVAVDAFESPRSPNCIPVSIPVEDLGLLNSNDSLGLRVCIPVESVGLPHSSNQVRVSVPVEAMRSPHSKLVPAAYTETTQDSSSSMQVKGQASSLLKVKKKLTGIRKDGTPDGRFKTREGLGVVRKREEDTQEELVKTVDEPAANGTAGEVHVKKLPEVQKNGMRKPKRVQLTRLFVEKPEVNLPSGNDVINSRVVKSLWSPKQLKQTGEVGSSFEPFGPHRPIKSTKFLSLQELQASGKLNKMRARPASPQTMKESEDSASDRTVSDCSNEETKLNGQASIVTTCKPPKLHKNHQGQSMKSKARLPKKEQYVNQTVGSFQLIASKKKGKVTRRAHGEVPAPTVATKTRKQPKTFPLKEKKSQGNLNGGPRVVETTQRGREQPTTLKQREEMTNRNLKEVHEGEESPLQARKQPIDPQQVEETENFAEGPIDDPLSPRASMQSPSPEQITGGDFEGAVGFPRMTPRTRKLTDAMQHFLHQKASLLRQWKEMELGKLHPMALIGRSCKIYWPLDKSWYPGVIHEYDPKSRKHRIDYEDDEREWVNLGKERVKLHVSAEESKTLEMSFGEGSLMERKKLDADELAVLAAGLEGSHGELTHGDLVWAKVKGYPMWPACVMDEEHANYNGVEPSPRERTVPVMFFGSYDHARINAKKVVPFAKGIVHKYHTKCKRIAFEQGLQEIEWYLKECKLPEQMHSLEEDVEAVVNNKKADDFSSSAETDEGEPDESNSPVQKTWDTSYTFPLELGTLRVLTLGKIVKDSEQFHNDTHIWTEGYIAMRKFASMKDPERIIEYKMEVLRNPQAPSVPLFRVIPEDDKPVEASTASGCWKKILIKIQRAKEKAGLCIATLLEKKRQSFRSGPSMFGFGDRRVSRLIQALPNSRVCSKFTSWIDKPLLEDGAEELTPAGYRPVDVNWKHLDRCNVCYLDEEYADNQLLQCDKCRTMVHMYCYGELEPPDGDLWLCNLCRPGAPKRTPFCCLCPVTGGAMKATTDGRWAHLTCAMWTPETCLVDVKRMEPVDGISSINKERWKLICTVCKVPYGACIQCSKPRCGVAFHPLCARSAGLGMEVLEDKATSLHDADGGLQLLTYCKKHSVPIAQGGSIRPPSQQAITAPQNCPTVSPLLPPPPPSNSSGCARSEPYNAASRRGHREPEALAVAMAKRFFVENKPYMVTGCQRNAPNRELKSMGVSLWSLHWKQPKSCLPTNGEGLTNADEADGEKTPQSTSERYRHMRSTLHERLTFGKSSIHGWGVFTKRPHNVGDMVIEYAGEVVRPIIADIRERHSYDSLVGAGTYMFRIDDERVVDATHAGSIAHLINHSCEPNCYSRVVTASGDDHIIIFAKREIQQGEELTYDYRFASKDELLTCYCGCAGCRGFVNKFDTDEEPTRIIASRSDLTEWVGT